MATKVSIPALIQALGGKENLAQATHCATRLRVTTRDKSKIDEAALKAIPGVLGVVNNGTQTQIIIGAEVTMFTRTLLRRPVWTRTPHR